MAYLVQASPASFVVGSDRKKISVKKGENLVEYSEDECIKFKSYRSDGGDGFQILKGKIHHFSHDHDLVTHIFIKLWNKGMNDWEKGLYSINFMPRHYGHNPIGNWENIEKIGCPDISQMGGRRRKHRRRPSRKVRRSRHRKTRKY